MLRFVPNETDIREIWTRTVMGWREVSPHHGEGTRLLLTDHDGPALRFIRRSDRWEYENA